MKTILIQVGKTVNKHFIAGINDYVERVNHYMPFEVVTIPELKNTKNLTEDQQKQAEGELILKQLQPSDTVVLLDEHGSEYRSIEFARWLEQKRNTARRLVFVIGGPYGFSKDVYARANEQLSLSKMTFSHQMIRLTFTEQVYRACTIIKGEPYHHQWRQGSHKVKININYFSGICFSTSSKWSQTICTVGMCKRSSGVWTKRSVGPNDTISRLG